MGTSSPHGHSSTILSPSSLPDALPCYLRTSRRLFRLGSLQKANKTRLCSRRTPHSISPSSRCGRVRGPKGTRTRPCGKPGYGSAARTRAKAAWSQTEKCERWVSYCARAHRSHRHSSEITRPYVSLSLDELLRKDRPAVTSQTTLPIRRPSDKRSRTPARLHPSLQGQAALGGSRWLLDVRSSIHLLLATSQAVQMQLPLLCSLQPIGFQCTLFLADTPSSSPGHRRSAKLRNSTLRYPRPAGSRRTRSET